MNVKVLVILVAITGLLGGGVVVGHYVQKRLMADRALAAGRKAIADENWADAAKHLRVYLSKYPDNLEVLQEYAAAHLSVRPLETGNILAAIGGYRRLLRHRPGDPDLCHTLARLYASVGNFSEAVYIARQRLKHAPDDHHAQLDLAQGLAGQRNYSEAIDVLTAVVNARPDLIEAYAALGALLMQRDPSSGKQEAAPWIETVVENNPQSPSARVLRARFKRIAGEAFEAVAEDLDACGAVETPDANTRLMLVEEWIAWGQYEQAEATLLPLREMPLDAFDADPLEAESLFIATRIAEGTLALRAPERADPVEAADGVMQRLAEYQRPAFLPTAVRLYLAGGAADKAEACLASIAKVIEEHRGDPAEDDTYVALAAQAAAARGRNDQAIRLLTDAHNRRKPTPDSMKMLAKSLAATGQVRRARSVLEECRRLFPNAGEVLLDLAATYRNEDWARVQRFAADAYSRQPVLAARLLELEAQMMQASGPDAVETLDEIRTSLSELAERFPDNTAIEVLSSRVLAREGRLAEAISRLEAFAGRAEALPVYLELANLHTQAGKPEDAVSACAGAVERFPDAAEPRLKLAELYRRAGRTAEARRSLETALDAVSDAAKPRIAQVLVQTLLAVDDADGAVALVRRVAAPLASSVDIRMTLLSIPAFYADRAAAQEVVDQIRKIQGDGGVQWKLEQAALWLRSKAWRDREREALALLGECLEADPGWERPALLLGATLERLGRWQDAKQTYQATLTENPGAVAVAERLVALLVRQGRDADAEEVIARLPNLSPTLIQRQIELYVRAGLNDQALDKLARWVRAYPTDAPARARLARLTYQLNQDPAAALRILDEAGDAGNASADILAARVAILHEAGKPEEALRLLDDAVSRAGDFASYRLRGNYLVTLERFDAAEEDYRRLTTFESNAAGGYQVLGEFYRARGRAQEALASWDAGLRVTPDHPALRRDLVRTLAASGDPVQRERARVILEGLRDQIAGDPDLLRIDAFLALVDGGPSRQAEAVEKLDGVIQMNPLDVEAHLTLANLARQRGDYRDARSLLVRALAANPSNIDLQVARTVVEIELGYVVAAREFADTLLDAHPDDMALHNRLASLFQGTGEPGIAQRINARALTLAPHDESANVARAAILASMGESAEARARLEDFIASADGSESVAALAALASQYTSEGDFRTADELLVRAESLSPDDPRLLTERMTWWARQSRWDELQAAVSTEDAEPDPDSRLLFTAAYLLASAEEQRHVGRARTLFERLAERMPANVDALRGIAGTSYALDDIDGAIAALRELLVLMPKDAESANNLAWMLAQGGAPADLAEAESLANAGLAHHPENVHLLDTRGVILHKMGRLNDARRDLERCIALCDADSPTRVKAMLHLARVRHDQRAPADELRERLETIHRSDPQRRILSDPERTELQRLRESL